METNEHAVRSYDYDTESVLFESQVKQKAAELIRQGVATPWNAIALATKQVLVQRRIRKLQNKDKEMSP